MEAAGGASVSDYHETRFGPNPRREVLWKTLVEDYFQPLIPRDGCTLELGAGYAHFINHVRCRKRIALDTWEGLRNHVVFDVEALVQSACDLSGIDASSVD